MNALRLRIFLEEPLLMTGVANGEPNSATTLNYIPGSAIRGACIAAYCRRHPTSRDLSAPGEPTRALFFEENIFFLNGYPALPLDHSARALPRPLAWYMEKGADEDERHPVYDFALQPYSERQEDVKNPKGEGRLFFWQEVENPEEPTQMGTPRRQIAVHNASDAPMRKAQDNSTVFRYVALAPGQHFVAYVVSKEESLLQSIKESLTDGRLFLGGSQTAGYGATLLAVDELTNWDWDKGEAQLDHKVSDMTIITLLSDAILRDAHGQPSTDFNAVLRTHLGKPADWGPQRVFVKHQLIGGFNRKWGLPLPQRWAVAMGSTYVYEANALKPQELRDLLLTGIGERRNEGFGRIGVNLNRKAIFATTPPPGIDKGKGALSPPSTTMARQMARRRLSNQIATAIPSYVERVEFKGQPENSQLTRLREVVRKAQYPQANGSGLGMLTTHLESLTKATKDQFRQSFLRAGGSTLSWERWLKARATDVDGLTLLKIDPADERHHMAGESIAKDPQVLQAVEREATCQLIDALLRKALRQGDVQ